MATGEIPEVGGTAVTAKALDVGEAWTLPAAWVTVAPVSRRAVPGIRAQQVTAAACARHNEHNDQGEPEQGTPTAAIPSRPTLTVTALSGSLPVEARLAVGTAWPLRVV